MDDIKLIYNNKFGLAFQWKKNSLSKRQKVQLIFRDTGMYLNMEQIEKFVGSTRKCLNSYRCAQCPKNENCRSILVESPISDVSFAMNPKEITELQDLLEGTLFELQFDDYFRNLIN